MGADFSILSQERTRKVAGLEDRQFGCLDIRPGEYYNWNRKRRVNYSI